MELLIPRNILKSIFINDLSTKLDGFRNPLVPFLTRDFPKF